MGDRADSRMKGGRSSTSLTSRSLRLSTSSHRRTTRASESETSDKLRHSGSVKATPTDDERWKMILASSKTDFEKKWTSLKPSTASLDDFKLMTTLGTGSFGRVILASHRTDLNHYAIKILNKAKCGVWQNQIVKMKQVEHVLCEKKVLLAASFPFIASLTYSFKDNSNVYMALEYVNGGELFSLLRRSGKLSEEWSQFYGAQLVLVLEYLHNSDVLYRDLKPENLLFDTEGYLKLVDFGFAKRTRHRTYTVCGTPDYLAPEVILARGYGFAVDWWALGILLYEMTAGYPPFYAEQQLKIYEKILSGKFVCPHHMTSELRHLLNGLIQIDLTRRLGCLKNGVTDIKHHHWFAGIDWLAIYCKKVRAPFKPSCETGVADTSNFDKFSDEDIVVGPTDECAKQFSDF